MSTFEHAGERWNKELLKSITEEAAVRKLPMRKHSQVRKAWKIANGLSVPNHMKEDEKEEPKPKRTRKKKEEE